MSLKSILDQAKIEAFRLSREVKNNADSNSGLDKLLKRLSHHPALSHLSLEKIQARLPVLGLPDCLQVIAIEQGAASWQEFAKKNQKSLDESLQQSDDALLYKPRSSAAGLNVWFPTYTEAKEYLNSRGINRKGLFLFPYKKTFFICQPGHLDGLGINSNDPDWEKIGFDWVKSLDLEAKNRLREKMIEARKKEISGA